MTLNKTLALLIGCGLLLGTSSFAKKPEEVGQEKVKKQKVIPYGLQKKVQSGKELPPGWQKKIAKGEVVDDAILQNAKVVDVLYPSIKGTKVYEVGDKIFRLQNATREILEVLK